MEKLEETFDLIDVLARTVFEPEEADIPDIEVSVNESPREPIQPAQRHPKRDLLILNKFHENVQELSNYIQLSNLEHVHQPEILDQNGKQQLLELRKALENVILLRSKAIMVAKLVDIPELKNADDIIKENETLIQGLNLEMQQLKSDLVYLKMEKIDIQL